MLKTVDMQDCLCSRQQEQADSSTSFAFFHDERFKWFSSMKM